MLELFKEGKAKFYAAKGTISSKLEVFYNPAMKLNRDICIYIVKKLKPKTICEAMAASGVRAIRLALETDSKNITANEANLNVISVLEKNVKLNKVEDKVKVTSEHAQVLLRNSKYDYVDIDPFGPPAPYVPDALDALHKSSILALTATDTSCLCGRYVKACQRKYGSRPLKCGFEKEIGLRIMIASAQLSALKKNISLVPIFSHSSNHYLRTYLQSTDEEISSNIGYMLYCPKCLKRKTLHEIKKESCCGNDMLHAGPLWLGRLWDKTLTKDFELIKHLKEESSFDAFGFYDTHKMAKIFEKPAPRIEKLIDKLKAKGYNASRTHFKPEGIRTDAPLAVIRSFL